MKVDILEARGMGVRGGSQLHMLTNPGDRHIDKPLPAGGNRPADAEQHSFIRS